MRGLTFHGDQDVRVEDVPDAQIQKPTDALVKVTMAGICGSDQYFIILLFTPSLGISVNKEVRF